MSLCHSVSFQDTAEVQSITLAARQAYALRCFQTGDLDKLESNQPVESNLEGPNNLFLTLISNVTTHPNVHFKISESYILDILQVVPGRAGGGSFKRKKNYIAKKEFAYRMCAR